MHNILPASVAEEFRLKGSVEPKYLEDVTIIFTDFVGKRLCGVDDFPPVSWRKIAQQPLTYCHPNQSKSRKTDFGCHAAHLAIFSL